MGDLLRLSPWCPQTPQENFLGSFCVENAIWLLGFFGVVVFFSVSRKIVAAPYIYFSQIIVKSLQFRGCRQIAEPHKYYIVHVIVFFSVCFLYFFVSHRLGIRLIPYSKEHIDM